MDAASAHETKQNILGIRLDFNGGMSVSKEMLRSAAFQKFVNTLKSDGFTIKMTLPQTPGGSSSIFLGIQIDPSVEQPEDQTNTTIPAAFHEHLGVLRQFLQENAIVVLKEVSGVN